MKKIRVASMLLAVLMLFVIIMTACSAVNDVQSKDFTFEKIEGGYAVTAYRGDNEAPVIPENYKGEPVIAIGKGAFSGNETIIQISFIRNITSIGEGAFENCTSLAAAMLSNEIAYVGANAFAGCNKLSVYCEGPAANSIFWNEMWNPDGAPVEWESKQGFEWLTFELVKDLATSLLSSCGSSAGKVIANTIMSELGFGEKLDPRYTEELKKVRDELTKLNEQVDKIDKKLDAIKREVLNASDRAELSNRMSTVNQYISKINTLYDEYLDLANADDPALRKTYSKKLTEKIEKADIPTMLSYINSEMTENGGGSQRPILTLYNGFLEKVYPFKHESGELTRMFYEHISAVEAKGTILHTAFCNYRQVSEPENAAYYKEQNAKLLEKEIGYLQKQASIIPQEDDYKVVIDTLKVPDKGEYPIYRMINNSNGAAIYLMDHALPSRNVTVIESTESIKEEDPDDDMYYRYVSVPSLVVPTPLVRNLARTNISALQNFFSVKNTYGDDGLSNFDYLVHHLPQANLKNVLCKSSGPFVIVNDKPKDYRYLPGVLLNNLNKGLVEYEDGVNNVMEPNCDTLILWTDDNNRPMEERLVMYYQNTGR